MTWLDSLKRLFKEEEKVIVDEKTDIVSFEQIHSKVDEKIKEHSKNNEQLKKEIIERITQFETDIASVIATLEKIDLSNRKEHEKIKLVVTENLSLYVAQLKRLVYNLKNIHDLDAKPCIDKLFHIWNGFNKDSHIPFEKATILIGKELETARLTLKSFMKDMNDIANNNKPFFEEINATERLNTMLQELKENDKFENEVASNIDSLKQALEKIRNENEALKNKISSIMISQEYRKDAEKKNEHKEKIIALEDEIQSLKEKINLKLLARHFHHDERKSQIIKNYSNNFKSALKEDVDLELMEFIKSVHGNDFLSLIDLKSKISEFNKPFITETEKEIINLENNNKNLELSTAKIYSDIEINEKRKNKLLNKKENIILESKNLAHSLFPNLVIK